MRFRLKAFGAHLLGSAAVLSLALAALFFGWYRWPGWYLSNVLAVAAMLAGIDVILGPFLTLLIANPAKSRRELARDIGVIIAAQLIALGYGVHTLWNGRPLYYTFSNDRLEMVRAFEVVQPPAAGAQASDPALAPHWWRAPRWVWAPLPDDPKVAEAIVAAAVAGEADVIDMPRYYRPWLAGLPALRAALQPPDQLRSLTAPQKAHVKARMRELGFSVERPVAIAMIGRGAPLVAVFEPTTMQMQALLFTE